VREPALLVDVLIFVLDTMVPVEISYLYRSTEPNLSCHMYMYVPSVAISENVGVVGIIAHPAAYAQVATFNLLTLQLLSLYTVSHILMTQ